MATTSTEFFLVIYNKHGNKAQARDIQHIQNAAELLNKMQKLLMAGEPFKIFEATEAFSLPRPVL